MKMMWKVEWAGYGPNQTGKTHWFCYVVADSSEEATRKVREFAKLGSGTGKAEIYSIVKEEMMVLL